MSKKAMVRIELLNDVIKQLNETGSPYLAKYLKEGMEPVENQEEHKKHATKKVEIDVELLNELDRLIDTIGVTYDVGNKRGHEIISIVKGSIEKAEREEKILKAGSSKYIDFLTKQANKETEDLNALRAEGTFKLSPETVRWLCDGRIDKVEKSIDLVMGHIGIILERQGRFLKMIEGINNKS